VEAAIILLVDDDVSALAALSDLLCIEGYVTILADNGYDALRWIKTSKSPPDLIILDLLMPVMDGWEFLARKCSDRELGRIPVVVVSAFSTPIHADAIFKKPIDLQRLFPTIARLIPTKPHVPSTYRVDGIGS
jgi:CheY-like chemotaxis protein